MFMKTWQNRFKTLMEEHQQSQEAIANNMGVTQGAVGHWLSGRRDISLSTFFQLCMAAGFDPKYILFGDNGTVHAVKDSIVAKVLTANPSSNEAHKEFVQKTKRSRAVIFKRKSLQKYK